MGSEPPGGTDLDFDAGQEPTGRTESGARDGVAEQRGAVVVGAEDSDGGAGLRQAVGIDEIDAGEQPNRLLENGNGHLGAAVSQGFQGGYIRVRPAEVFGDLASMVGTSRA